MAGSIGGPGGMVPGDWLRPRRTRPEKDLAPGWWLRLISVVVLVSALCVGETYVTFLGFLSSCIGPPLALPPPLLLGLNLLLLVSSSNRLKVIYRVVLPVSLLIMWPLFFLLDPRARETTLWILPLAVTVVAGVEIAIVVRERREEEKRAAAASARRRDASGGEPTR